MGAQEIPEALDCVTQTATNGRGFMSTCTHLAGSAKLGVDTVFTAETWRAC
jgi:hypothetical protein